MEIEVIDSAGAGRIIHEQWPLTAVTLILLGGDRFTCCDEWVVIKVDDHPAAIASIAPEGEQHDGQPSIVGVYVRPGYRRRGYGRAVFRAAIQRCLERGLTPIRVDVLSTAMRHVLLSVLAEFEDPGILRVTDFHGCLDPVVAAEGT